MNLIKDVWIPIRRESGSQELIAPWQLTETDDPVIALNAPRPDFNGALMQFLIGLLQTTVPPSDHSHWLDWLEKPPSPETLKDHFSEYAHAFELQSEKGSFMQDMELLDSKIWPIEKLIMESPGDNTTKLNKDHFFKREQFEKMCPSCTAIALFSFQLYTQGFGASHRVSLRGKGPLTTLVVLDTEVNNDLSDCQLWLNVWLNVLDESWFGRLAGAGQNNSLADIFPWMGKTRLSTAKKVNNQTVYLEGGQATTPSDTNLYQVFWSMPCRVNLDFSSSDGGTCDLCGMDSRLVISGFRIQKFGIDYIGSWRHPLSPHVLNDQGEAKPFRVPSGGIQYQHWLGLVEKTDKQNPALVAERYMKLSQDYQEQFRLYSFGYEIDRENKARCWYEATFPLITIPDDIRIEFSKRVQTLTEIATQFAGFVRSCVKEAWFQRPGDAKGDTSFLVQSFYQHTEGAFYLAVKALQHKLKDGTDQEILQQWHGTLRKAAFELFDYWAAQGDFTQANPRRIAAAHNKLGNMIYGKKIRAALQLPRKTKEAA